MAEFAGMETTIATYNISFMSDLGIKPPPGWASETSFLLQNDDPDGRKFWLNALSLLKKFISEKTPLAVGLQEMNLTPLNSNTGSDAVNKMIGEVNATTTSASYKQVCHEVALNPNQKPALSIIFDTVKLGHVKSYKIVDNTDQPGRPLLMVLTDKNYLLLNTHGLQDPRQGKNFDGFNDFNGKQVGFIQTSAETFLGENEINGGTLAGVILVGDFNDRFDQIRRFVILGKEMSQTGDAPKSCCYNYDSSCPKDQGKFTKIGPVDKNYGYCNAEAPKDNDGKPVKGVLPGEDGFTKNYVNAGDKVFSSFSTEEMQIYPGANGDLSIESDHQMVYAVIKFPTSGGKRKTRKNHKKKHQKTNKKMKRAKKGSKSRK